MGIDATENEARGTRTCQACDLVVPASAEICPRCGADLTEPDHAFSPGDRIHDKYEVVELLGIGGMGEVYKVRHTALDVSRCIKLIKNSLLENERYEARFVREARLATRVHHPNVAIVHDFDVADDGRYYIVSEYIDGITVGEWGRRYGRFPVDLAIALTVQVLEGLGHIHSRGLLHRDISSENVMLTVDHEGRPMAKIIDLGIAKSVEGAADVSHATQVGMFVGNPKYASPEQLGALGDDETIDHRADLYCLSVVLYEMLAGAPPFRSSTPQGYVARHLTEQPPRFHDVELPDGLEDAVFRGLEKDRGRRHASAKEFARALERFASLADEDARRYGDRILGDLPPDRARTLTDVPVADVATDADTVVRDVAEPLADRTETGTHRDLPSEDEAWQEAVERGTREGWEAFRRDFPETERGPILRWLIEEATAFEAAKAGNDRTAWRDYLSRFGDGPHAAEARERLIDVVGQAIEEKVERTVSDGVVPDDERARWDEAARDGSSSAWQRFLDADPDATRSLEAKRRLAEAKAFERAAAAGTYDGFQAFLREWRAGAHASEARELLEQLLKTGTIGWDPARAGKSGEAAPPSGRNASLIFGVILVIAAIAILILVMKLL